MKENIKEKILLVSRELFNTYGYHEVTMRMIADKCNIGVGNLTYHYKKKIDIIYALLKEGEPTLSTSNTKTIEELYHFISEMVDGVRKNHFFFSSSQLQSLDESFFEANKQNVQKLHTAFISNLIEIQKANKLSEDFSKEEMEAYVSLCMLSHISWANEEGKNSTYTNLNFNQFVYYQLILLKPYLTEKGLIEFKNISLLSWKN